MSKLMLPRSAGRPVTALAGRSDVRDDNIYSSLVVCHGGSGTQKLFTVPQGQTLPVLKGSAINMPSEAHHTQHSDLTTNLQKAGELGSGIGDIAIRSIGIHVEQAGWLDTTAAETAYGATLPDLIEILAKSFFVMKVGGKDMIKGPARLFPTLGSAQGFVATTQTTSTNSIGYNGPVGQPRRLKIPIMVARNDTFEGVFGTANSASYVFRTTTGAGAETLVTVDLQAIVSGDVR